MDGEIVHFSVSDTGLGLAISKNLIELIGGNTQVESEPGKALTFHFYIQAN
jgi:signal transduction histidine kinase